MAAGNFSKAAEHYQIAIQTHPTAPNYFALGLAHARSGSFLQAEELFRKSIDLNPDFAQAYFNMAVIFAKTGRPAETVKALKQAIRINPDYTEAHYHLGLAYLAIHDAKGVKEEYAILSRLDPHVAERLRSLIEGKKASNISTE